MKRNPTGFIALCQCGVITGAMDLRTTENKEAGKLLGKWLHKGCSVHPQFGGTWEAHVQTCQCESKGQP